jgi:hypothetical protein
VFRIDPVDQGTQAPEIEISATQRVGVSLLA